MIPQNFCVILAVSLQLCSFYQLAFAKLNPLLNPNETYSFLIDPESGQETPVRDYMDFDNIYEPNETYKLNINASARNYHLIKAFDFANYYRTDYWRYSDPEDLRVSAQPVANKALCAKQVNWMINQLNRTSEGEDILFQRGQEHLNLMTFLDSYGKPESAVMAGRNLWLGSHFGCTHVKVNITQFEYEQCLLENRDDASFCGPDSFKDKWFSSSSAGGGDDLIIGRYCMGKARDRDWPQKDRYKPEITYRIGLCLPESCETLSFKELEAQLNILMKLHMPDYWRRRLNLKDMYCLPDERSPLRRMSFSGRLLLTLIAVWIGCVIVATILYSLYKHNGKQEVEEERPPGERQGAIEESSRKERVTQPECKYTATLSKWLSDCPNLVNIFKALSIVENMSEFSRPPRILRDTSAALKARINLNSVDFFKCFSCTLNILAHIVFIHIHHVEDVNHLIDVASRTWPVMFVSLFIFTDTFFMISGMLTSYMIFKRFDVKSFANPFIWLLTSILRLIRLTPMYILAFWFTKSVTIYLFDGPMWDYGTDNQSIKGLCKNESWWKVILYFGNYDTMQPLCLLQAWSVVLDSQYSLFMPLLIYLIMRYRKLAYLLIIPAIVTGTANMTWQLLTQDAVKATDIARIRLHVYPLICRFSSDYYINALNRFGPVAIGIVSGHALYSYDIGNIKQWPRFMRGKYLVISCLLHVFIIVLPVFTRLTDNNSVRNETFDLAIFIASNSTIKPIWVFINAIVLLRIMTDLRQHSPVARLMSHNFWHCFSKLTFAAYLTHYEILMIMLKMRPDGLTPKTWMNLGREFSFAFLLTISISYLIYILYEAPIGNLLALGLKEKLSRLITRKSEVKADNTDERSNKKYIDSSDNKDHLKAE